VLVAEGAAHRAQRRVLNPAFGPAQLRALTGVFLDKANEVRPARPGRSVLRCAADARDAQLRDVCAAHVAAAPGAPVDMLALLSRATLDVIGLAGFGYDFGSLARAPDDPSELSKAFAAVFAPRGFSLWAVAQGLVPALRHLPTPGNRVVRGARATMDRIGGALIAERKAAGAQSTDGKDGAGQKDLLSLLVRANTAADAAQRLSDADVRAQIPTFLLAGHETTSTGVAWALFALARHPAVLAELRSELRASPLPTGATGNAPLEQDALAALDRLPLLDAVVRETMRLYAPVPSTIREAVQDAALPLSAPFTDRHGVQQHEIRCALRPSPSAPAPC
jgi:cytochrome P450